MKLVFISQDYDTDDRKASVERANTYSDYVLQCGFVPVNPITMFEKYYGRDSAVDLQDVKHSLIKGCDMLWHMGDVSEEMRSDVKNVEYLGLPVMYVTDDMVADRQYICQNNEQLTADDVIPLSDRSDYTNQLLVVKPNIMRDDISDGCHSLYYAESGFGCSPTARGRAVYVQNIATGEKMRFERYDFMGIVKPESFVRWLTDHPVDNSAVDSILLEMAEQSNNMTEERSEER